MNDPNPNRARETPNMETPRNSDATSAQPAPAPPPPGKEPEPPPQDGTVPAKKLTAEEQMALYEDDLKENDWGHQPC